jgi:hypothetical protein
VVRTLPGLCWDGQNGLSVCVAGTIVKWQNMPKQMMGMAWNAGTLSLHIAPISFI